MELSRKSANSYQISYCSGISTIFRILYPLLILLSLISCTDAQARCFNIPKGLSIAGAEYRRLRDMTHRGCALECRDDPSCLAYEWIDTDKTCFFKSRSLNGTLTPKENTVLGFCLDEDDMIRDRFRDHVIAGPEVASKTDVDGDDCRGYCMTQPESAIYSWTPNNPEDDEDYIGTCTCLESIRGMTLQFNAFAGILPPKRHPRRAKFAV